MRLVGAASPGEVMFVSCGSEADNHAVAIGVAHGRAQLQHRPGARPHVRS
eukprot:COSAG01_NODE_8745_length_2674_cov_2.404660_5_plen_50_part_00